MALSMPKRAPMVRVARDSANANRDYYIPEPQAKALFAKGLLAHSPDTKSYLDEDGRTYAAIRQGRITTHGDPVTPGRD